MRTETKIVRDILKKEFPNEKFLLYYKEPNNYCDSSDKIIINTNNEKVIDHVINVLKKYVFKVAVGKFTDVFSVGGKFDSRIKDIQGNIIEFEPEFILVKYINKK